ncbi:MAG: hypothetical protein ACOYXO_12840, partial [Chloroflexota bacterium]
QYGKGREKEVSQSLCGKIRKGCQTGQPFSAYYSAHASMNPMIASNKPRCRNKLLSTNQPAAKNCKMKLTRINIPPVNGSNPLRFARKEETLSRKCEKPSSMPNFKPRFLQG